MIVAKQSLYTLICMVIFLGTGHCTQADMLVREKIAPDVYATLRGTTTLFLECSPPTGNQAQAFFERYLENPNDWRLYRDRIAVAIPFTNLNSKTQRHVLEALFPLDYVDAAGWWHTVRFSGRDGTECLASIAEWLTGTRASRQRILSHDANRLLKEPLSRGDRFVVPQPLLSPVMRTHSPNPLPPPPPILPAEQPAAVPPAPPLNNDVGNGLLTYAEDGEGPYAEYTLRQGESLYSAVVVRFTDYRENEPILQACEIIRRRSNIHNVRRMRAGQRVLIPLEMLSDRYQPAGSESRKAYEAVRTEVRQLQTQQIGTKDLDGVVVVLDPGHGGHDRGAAIPHLALYEDEINYDIVCRIKKILETQTLAKVYVTVYDPIQGYAPTDATRFVHDTNELLLTTPHYRNDNATVSANLRWYLANDIYYRERANGVDHRKILFASIHCDALFNASLRGAMVYVPGAQYRRDNEQPKAAIYQRFEEVRRHPSASSTTTERRRDEVMSSAFAVTLLNAMRNNTPPLKVHDAGDPIRNVIRQSGGRAYVPAVLRNNAIPTKVLVEVANMTNPTDQRHLADPKWRQWFAEAFVNALRNHYGN